MTTQFLCSKEQLFLFKKQFKQLSRTGSITPSDVVMHNLVRGLDPKRGFTDITNQVKLTHGAVADQGYAASVAQLKLSLRWTKSLESLAKRYDNALDQQTISTLISQL